MNENLGKEKLGEMLEGCSFAYVVTEFFDNGDTSVKGVTTSKKKFSFLQALKFFNEIKSKIIRENTKEERQTKRKMVTYLELSRCLILFNEYTGEYELDIETAYNIVSELIEGEIYKDIDNE